MINVYDDYLSHHGIKGQKWGIRRYQNDDGTLTPEGRERYLRETERAYNESREMRKEFRRQAKANPDVDFSEAVSAASKAMKYEERMRDYINSQANVKIGDIFKYSSELGKKMGVKNPLSLGYSETVKLNNATRRSLSIGDDGKLSPLDKWDLAKKERRRNRFIDDYLNNPVNKLVDPDGELLRKKLLEMDDENDPIAPRNKDEKDPWYKRQSTRSRRK